MNAGYWKEEIPVPGTDSDNRSVGFRLLENTPFRGFPISDNRPELSADSKKAVTGISHNRHRPASFSLADSFSTKEQDPPCWTPCSEFLKHRITLANRLLQSACP